MAVSGWCCRSGCEDTAVQCLTGRQSQVSAGGGHQWAVQTPQCSEASRSRHCGGTSEYKQPTFCLYMEALYMFTLVEGITFIARSETECVIMLSKDFCLPGSF